MKIGQAIKKLRKEQSFLNQGQYAQEIGITQTYLSLIECGKRIPNMSIIKKIADYHCMPIGTLFWFGIEESDISEAKIEAYRLLKPSIDKMIESIM